MIEKEKKESWKTRWLWLVILIAAFVCFPLWYFLMATGTRLLSMVIGPVNIWNSATHEPSGEDLAGFYRIYGESDSRLHARGVFLSESSSFKLSADHKFEAHDLPAFDDFGKARDCTLNGLGNWRLSGPGMDVQLSLDLTTRLQPVKGSLPTCETEDFGSYVILGHHAPYHFWQYIGDPDEDEGLTWRRVE